MMIEKVYNNFIEEAETFFVTKFVTSPTIKKEYSQCLDIIFDITKTQDPGRGIIAFNQKYGQGKSFFFDVVNHRYKRQHNGQNLFKRITAKDLCQIYTSAKNGEDPMAKLIEATNVKRLFIDDIGDEGENKVFKHYANELNVLRFVLLKRYELWMSKGFITYGTTNLTIEQMASNYDGRVSDRVLQMCYWKEFKFLAKGSFRQVAETRKLTIPEIKKAWEKFKIEKPVEKIDLEKYFNELIHEPDSYFENKDISFWTFVKNYLISKELMSVDDFVVDDEMLQNSRVILKVEVKEDIKKRFKHSTGDIRSIRMDEALKNIKPEQVMNVAENVFVKRRFMDLRINKHNFK